MILQKQSQISQLKKWKKVEIENWIGYWYNINFGIEYNENPEANHLNCNNTGRMGM